MVSKRLLAALIFIPLLSIVSVAEATLVPNEYFSSPLFWAGFIFFFIMGSLVFMNPKISGKVSGPIIGGIIIGLAAASTRGYSNALVFVFGFPGLITGIAVRGFYSIFYRTRWGYCPTCKSMDWMQKKERNWYCMKYGHKVDLLQRSPIPPSKSLSS